MYNPISSFFCQPFRRTLVLKSVLLLAVLGIMTGCQLSQSAFVRTVGNAGSAFSAASTTLSYAHEGKITDAYARSSFEVYQSELRGLKQQLPSQAGAPDRQIISSLQAIATPALQAVDRPCLDAACNWRMQVAALDRASKAFLKAGGQ